MKIVIDMQGAQINRLGIGIRHYITALIKALIQEASGGHEFHFAFNGQLEKSVKDIYQDLSQFIPPKYCSCWYAPAPLNASNPKNSERRFIASEIYSQFLLSLKPDLILLTDFFGGYEEDSCVEVSEEVISRVPIACLLHDRVLSLASKATRKNKKHQDYHEKKLLDLKRIPLILASSQFIADDWKHFTESSPIKQDVHNIGTGTCLASKKISEKPLVNAVASPAAKRTNKQLFIFSDSLHKSDLDIFFKAISLVPFSSHSDITIHLFTSDAKDIDIYSMSSASQISRNNIRLYNQPQPELFYELSSTCQGLAILFSPSVAHHTILEAISAGIPCISMHDNASLDLLGGKNYLFKCNEPQELIDLLRKILIDQEFHRNTIDIQQRHADRLSWATVAQNALLHLKASKYYPSHGKLNSINNDIDIFSVAYRIQGFSSAPASIEALSNCIVHTFNRQSSKKCLFVDISELTKTDHKTGIQRVVRAILQNLVREMPEDWDVVAVYADIHRDGYFVERRIAQTIEGMSYEGRKLDERALFKTGDILFVLDLQHIIALRQEAFLSELRSRGVSVYFAVYDILPITLPHCFADSKHLRQIHSEWLKLIAKMDGYYAISESVMNEVATWYESSGITLSNYFHQGFFHLGADLDGSLPSQGLPENYVQIMRQIKSRPSFLQVSTLEPRKAHAEILDAFELLWSNNYDLNLVFVGKNGWLVDGLVKRINAHPEFGRRLFWLQGISDQMLDMIYAASTCCIMASYGEGFGLPLVEAAQKGTPIIARDIPVFREVAGENAFFFQSEQPLDLAKAISDWLKLYSSSCHISSTDLKWLSWRDSAKQLSNRMLHAYYSSRQSVK